MPKSKWVREQEQQRAKAAELKREVVNLVDDRDWWLDGLEVAFDAQLEALFEQGLPKEEREAEAKRLIESFGQQFRAIWDAADQHVAPLRAELNK